MEIGLNLGVCLTANSKVSTTRRMDGSGGEMYSFCAMYSLRMSFCRVPEILFQSAPCFSATARYMAQITGAGEFMVIEVVTSERGIWSNSTSMSARELMATPHLPTSPSDNGWSE